MRDALNAAIGWLFDEPPTPVTPWRAFVWWEKRRIPFNVVVGAYGVICLLILFAAVGSSGHREPGEDVVEPLLLLLAPVGINALYTLGWLVEVPLRLVSRDIESEFGPLLLRLGLSLGFIFMAIPAALWVGYRALQFMGLAS